MFKHKTTCTEFLRAGEGIATSILADRLGRLEHAGIIESGGLPSGGYRLTPKGVRPRRSARLRQTTQRTNKTDGGTLLSQRREYTLKFGLVGRLMDAVMVRSKWDAGIKDFFTGLKRHVEANA